MAKLDIQAGSVSISTNIFVQDSSSTVGAGLSGLAYNTAGLIAYYNRPRSSVVSITLASLAAVDSPWTSGGFIELDATNMKGWYRFDFPDACFASGVRSVGLNFSGATNMAPCPLEVQITGWNNQDAVRGGMTALPNANAEAAGGLYTRGSGAGQINQTSVGTVDVNAVLWSNGAIVLPSITGVPIVDIGYILHSISAGGAGYAGLDWGHILAPTTAQNLSGTTIATLSPTGQVSIATTLLDLANAVDTYTVREILRVNAAVLAGILSGASTTTVSISAIDGSKVRVTATVDAVGNRSAVIVDAT